MKLVSVETPEKSVCKMTFSASPEELEAASNAVYERTRASYTIRGFKKGEADRAQIEADRGEHTFWYDAINDLMDKAEENGIAFDNIKTSVEAKSNGSLTLKLDLGKDTAPVEVEVTPQDDAQTVTTKVAQKAADNAASKAVKDSGLTGQAASTANSMAQDALQAGLSALPDMPGVDMDALLGGGN